MEPNKLDFVPRLSFLPFEWRTLGAAFQSGTNLSPSGSGRCSFVMRQGVDPLEKSSTGRVVEGTADTGVALHHKTFAIGLTASNLTFRSGLDDPSAAASQLVGEGSVPSLKMTAAKRIGSDDSFVAISYDLKQRKPELSACWAGDAPRERSTVLVSVDPVMRAVRLSAAVSTPGPEWRKILYDDETDQIEYPQDDGGRHTAYVQHVVKGRDLLHRTRIGCRLDLGRLINFAVDYFDYNLEEHIPAFVWGVPGLGHLYNLIVPPEDDDQVRHRINGWELDVSHEFGVGNKPRLELTKSLGASKRTTLSASYDLGSRTAGVAYSRPGVTVGARVARGAGAWGRPSLTFMLEPLSLEL